MIKWIIKSEIIESFPRSVYKFWIKKKLPICLSILNYVLGSSDFFPSNKGDGHFLHAVFVFVL